MDDATRVLGLHMALAAAGAAALVFAVAALASSLSFDTPAGVAQQSHWDLVRSALTVGSAGTLALGSLSLAVALAALGSLRRQWLRSRSFLRELRILRQGPEATLVADDRPLAFCAGLLRPRVYLSTGTLTMLDGPQLAAVMAHERHHARRRDPLRLLVVRAVADALFVLPALPPLADRYAALIEMTADDAAVAECGSDPAPLAGALLAFDERSNAAVVGIDPLRVDHLCGEGGAWHVPTALVAWSGLILAGIVVAALRASEASQELNLAMPLLAHHLCLLAVDLGPLLAGAAALLFGRSVLSRR